MRSLLPLLAVLVAAGLLAWFLVGGGSGGEGDDVYDDGPIEEGDVDAGPGLTAAGKKREHVPAETRGHGWIQGTVTRDGAAVPAAVELRHLDSIDPRNPLGNGIGLVMIGRMLDSGVSTKPVLQQAEAGEDGTFRFMGLAPGRYEVRATAENGAMGFTPASLPALGARVEASVELPTGTATLSGRVVHKDGTPYNGLVVATAGEALAVMFGGGGEVRPTRTDDQGHFKFGGLNPGKMSVSAIIPGVMRVMGPPVTLPHEGEYLLTIDAGGITVTGRAIAAVDESPVAGATVFGGGGDPNTSFSIRSTTSDADGRFALTLPAGRGGGFIVQADGYAPETVNMRGGPQEEMTVALMALGRVEGRVVTKENGTPVAGVTIFARGGDQRGGFPSAFSTVTDTEGRYALANLAPGTTHLHALGAGWISVGYGGSQGGATPFIAEVEPGQTGTLDIEVIPGAKAAGSVSTPAGEPVVGAVVQASNELGMGDMWTALLGIGSSFGASVTDEQGRYEIDVLAPGANYKITARAPDFPDAVSESFTASAGKTQEIDLQMAEARWLRVRVVDAVDGSPVGGASVALTQGGSGMMDLVNLTRAAGTRTDAAGQARLGPMRAGEKRVRISAPGYVDRDDVKYEDDGSDAPSLTVEMTRGLVIAGRVVVPEGVPAQSVRVTVRHDGSAGRGWYHQSPTVQADGSFRVDDIEHEGGYQVRANATWKERRFKGEILAESGSEDVVLELIELQGEDLDTLVVKVIDADGKPVPSGSIQLYQIGSNTNHTSSTSLSAGRATFRDLQQDVEVYIEVHDVLGGRGAAFVGPLAPTGGELEVRLPVGQTITGRAVGPDGVAVRGVRIAATAKNPAPNRDDGEEHATTVTDGDGNFTLKGLGELEYELRFTTPKNFAPTPGQTVRAGTSGVSVKLRAGLKAVLTVLDFKGKPLQGAHAWVRADNAGPQSWRFNQEVPRADQDGQIHLRGLDPEATYQLNVRPPESCKDLKPISKQEWRPQDETLRLEEAWRISGRVHDQNGKPAAGIWVHARREGTKSWDDSARTMQDGRFELESLDRGRYEVRTSSQHGIPRAPDGSEIEAGPKEKAVVAAGAKNVALTVDLGEKLVVRIRGLKDTHHGMSGGTLTPAAGGMSISGNWQGPGRMAFQGLKPGVSYVLRIAGLPENRYVHAKDVRTQADELEVEPKVGGRITGRVRMPEGVSFGNVSIGAGHSDGFHASGKVDHKTGTFVVEGLPDGEYHLHASAWNDGKSYQGSGKASTGGEVEIELKAR